MNEDMAYDWKVSWTTDDETWHESGFFTFEKAQKFALDLAGECEDNPSFCFFASRMMAVNRTSFLNARSAGAVELAPHRLGTADTFV